MIPRSLHKSTLLNDHGQEGTLFKDQVTSCFANSEKVPVLNKLKLGPTDEPNSLMNEVKHSEVLNQKDRKNKKTKKQQKNNNKTHKFPFFNLQTNSENRLPFQRNPPSALCHFARSASQSLHRWAPRARCRAVTLHHLGHRKRALAIFSTFFSTFFLVASLGFRHFFPGFF